MNKDKIVVHNVESGDRHGSEIDPIGLAHEARFLSDDGTLVVAHSDEDQGMISSWDTDNDNSLIRTVKTSSSPVWLEISPVDSIVAVACDDGIVNVVDMETGVVAYQKPFTSTADWGVHIEISPDGKKLVVAEPFAFHVFDLKSGEPSFGSVSYINADGNNCALAISPDSQWMAIASGDEVKTWSMVDGKEVGKPLFHILTNQAVGSVVNLSFSPDSKYLLTAGLDSNARVWDWRTGKIACPALKHIEDVYAAAFTPDGKYVITGSRGKFCGPHIWELNTGRRISPSWNRSLVRDGQTVVDLDISPDGKYLIANVQTFPDSVDYASMKYDLKNLFEITKVVGSIRSESWGS